MVSIQDAIRGIIKYIYYMTKDEMTITVGELNSPLLDFDNEIEIKVKKRERELWKMFMNR